MAHIILWPWELRSYFFSFLFLFNGNLKKEAERFVWTHQPLSYCVREYLHEITMGFHNSLW